MRIKKKNSQGGGNRTGKEDNTSISLFDNKNNTFNQEFQGQQEKLPETVANNVAEPTKTEPTKTEPTECEKSFPYVSEKGVPLKECWQNLKYLFGKWKFNVKLNVITQQIMVITPKKASYVNNMENIAIHMRGKAAIAGMKMGINDVYSYMQLIAYNNRFNPFSAYMRKCSEFLGADEHDYIEDVFNCFVLNASLNQNKEFLKKLFRKWLVSIIALSENDDAKASGQCIFILQGPQGIGKTSFARWLMSRDASFIRTGEHLDPENKDSLMVCLTCVLCELGEFGSTVKKRTS